MFNLLRNGSALAPVILLCGISIASAQTPATQPSASPGWQQQLTDGRTAIQQGRYADAEPLLRDAIDAAPHRSVQSAEATNELGKLYRLTAHYDHADSLDHDALALQEKLLGKENPAVATTLENLGELDTIRGFYTRADAELRRALEIRTKSFGEQSAEAAETMTNLGYLDSCDCKFDEAHTLCRRAVEIQAQVLSADDPALAFGLDNLGTEYLTHSRFVDAEAVWLKALHLRIAALGEDHPEVATSHDNLGWLYLNWGDFARARRYFNLARFSRENELGPDHPDTIESHAMYVAVSDPDPIKPEQSAPMLEKDLASESKILGPDHWFVCQLETSLAQTYNELGRTADAGHMFTDALERSRRTMGETHMNTAVIEQELGDFDRDAANKPDEAEKLYKQSLATMEKLLGSDDRCVGGVLESYAALLKKLNRDTEAAPMLERAHVIEDADQKRNPLTTLQGSGL